MSSSLSRAFLRLHPSRYLVPRCQHTLDTPIDLPPPSRRISRQARRREAWLRVSSRTPSSIDERREHQGRQAIARWKTEATAKYHYTSEPLAVDVSGAEVTVIARVTGEFPGSPIELRYRFTLEGDKIARLEITG